VQKKCIYFSGKVVQQIIAVNAVAANKQPISTMLN